MRMGLNQAIDEAGQLAANELRKADKSKQSRKGKRKSKRLMIMVSERRPVGKFLSKEDASLTTIHLMKHC